MAESVFIDVGGQYWEHRILLNQKVDESQVSSISLDHADVSRKLPIIPVPRFNGEPSSWIAYRAMSTAIVINSQLTGIALTSCIYATLCLMICHS